MPDKKEPGVVPQAKEVKETPQTKKSEAAPQAKKPEGSPQTTSKSDKKKLSVLKRQRQGEKRKIYNRAIELQLMSAIKNLSRTMSSGDKEKTAELLKNVTSVLDKAGQKGAIHRNKAARKKSSLAKKVNALLSA